MDRKNTENISYGLKGSYAIMNINKHSNDLVGLHPPFCDSLLVE